MDPQSIYLWLAIIFGFLMAWGIGANDVSNAMGTSVGSRAITIKQALIIAAIFEFLGVFIAGSEVTNTIRQEIIDPNLFSSNPDIFIIGMLASLLSAATWLLTASYFGWPVSTTHTIVGAVVGFGFAHLGIDAVQWGTMTKILFGWLISPIIGMVFAYILFTITHKLILNQKEPIKQAKKIVPIYILVTAWIISMISLSRLENIDIHLSTIENVGISGVIGIVLSIIGRIYISKLDLNPKADRKFHFTNVEKIFAVLMIFTACAMAFAHGSNDVANAIGPVAAVVSILADSSSLTSQSPVPMWVLGLGATGMIIGLGTYGHKVISTVGNRITQLTPSRGFAATLAAATTVVIASSTGLPISTTHTLVGGILGVGLARGIAALNLNVIRAIFMSWVITVPIGALLSVVFFKILKMIFIH